MKKLLFTALAVCMGVVTAFAVPAKRGVKRMLKLSDGTRIEAELQGDESFSFYKTSDGRALRRSLNGNFELADLAALQQEWGEATVSRNTARKAAQKRKIEYKGVRKGLVILVNFSNLSMTYTRSDFDKYFNEVGCKDFGLNGSVHDYFYEQSYGQFDLEFDVVGPYDLGHSYSYYGSPSGSNNDVRAQEMISRACVLADKDVNYKDYDWDGDGEVEQVYVIYAGYGEAQGADPTTIWPHEFTIAGSGLPHTFDGVNVSTYATSCEMHGDGETDTGIIDGIGTACHEFSHCMGIPDMYDTGQSGNFGMDVWDLMDYGCYTDEGNTPTAYTAYERWSCGWLEPIELSSPCHVMDMPCLEQNPVAYVVYNDANRNEYYLLENRQQVGFDKAAYGHGMLVVHVDYDANVWHKNQVNVSKSRQRMTIIPADNLFGKGGTNADGDPFPGTKNVTALTNTTTPGATLYNANRDGRKYMNKPIERIDETNGLISFDFMGIDPIPAPVVMAPTNVNIAGGSFTANWQPVSGATRYDLKLTRVEEHDPADYIIFDDILDKWYSAISSTSVDVSEDADLMDSYCNYPGWTGKYLYRSPHRMRVGKSGSNGWVQSPTISGPKSSSVTFVLGALSASAGTCNIEVSMTTSSGASGTLGTLSGTPSGTSVGKDVFAYFVFTVDNWVYGDFQMKFSSASGSGNFFVGDFACYDGSYTFDDIFGNAVKGERLFSESEQLAQPQRITHFDVNGIDWAESPFHKLAPRHSKVYADAGVYSSTTTSYNFSKLTPGTYIYKVRAVTADGNSQWSDEMTVGLGDGIEEMAAPVVPSDSRIYDLSGRVVTNPTHGIYMRNGKKFQVR